MRPSEPPVLWSWLLERLGPRDNPESQIGDLREQYQDGRSARWYRRQVFMSILAGIKADIGAHTVLAVRAFILASAAFIFLNHIYGSIRSTLIIDWGWVPSRSQILRQAVVYYGVPFEIVMWPALAATGWLIARWHRHNRVVAVLLSAMVPVLWAIPWAWETVRLLRAGLWTGWGYRVVLLVRAAVLFVIYPLCILLGGLWDVATPSHDRARPLP